MTQTIDEVYATYQQRNQEELDLWYRYEKAVKAEHDAFQRYRNVERRYRDSFETYFDRSREEQYLHGRYHLQAELRDCDCDDCSEDGRVLRVSRDKLFRAGRESYTAYAKLREAHKAWEQSRKRRNEVFDQFEAASDARRDAYVAYLDRKKVDDKQLV